MIKQQDGNKAVLFFIYDVEWEELQVEQLCSEYGDQFTSKQAQYAAKKVYE